MSDTLREYLISLGFKIDESSFKKFVEGTTKSAKAATELGSVAVASAVAVETAVVKVAKQYEDLYYAAQRSNSTVSNLKAFAFGGTQIGLSYDQARSSVEAFAAAVRTNPGLKALLGQYGVNEKDSTKQVIALVDRMKAQFGEGGYAVAARIVGMYGIDEATFKQMWDNLDQLKKSAEEYDALLKNAGINADKSGKQFQEFEQHLGKMEEAFKVLGERIAISFLGPTEKAIDALERLAEKAAKFNDDSGGVPGVVGTLAGTTAATAGVGWLGKKLFKRIFSRGVAKKAAEEAAKTVVKGGAAEAAEVAAGAGLSSVAGTIAGWLAKRLLGAVGIYFESTVPTVGPEDDEPLSQEYKNKHRQPGAAASDRDLIIRTVLGEAANQGPVGEVAVAEVIMNRLKSGKFGNSVSDVLFAPKQFEPWATRKNELMGISTDSAQYKRAAAIVDAVLSGQVADPTNGATNFANVGIVQGRGNMTAMGWIGDMIRNGSAVQIGDHLFGTPGANARGTGRAVPSSFDDRFNAALTPSPGQSSKTVTVTQENHFHVASTDPRAAAREVLDAQDRVQGDIVRNTIGAMR